LAEKLNANYFVYLFEGCSSMVLSLIEEAGHGTKRLRTDLWRSLEVYLPEHAEQLQIAKFLDSKTNVFDNLITKIHQAITHLKEYRTALISAAVTGKIDVREEGSEDQTSRRDEG
jgi:type I restriction enzyme S subunit